MDSGCSTHMLSRKDLNSTELESVRVSRNLTTVVTAVGEVQTKEGATVYVKDLDLFVTVHRFEDTTPVLSFWQLCEDHGYSNVDRLSKTTSYSRMKDKYHAILSRSIQRIFEFLCGTVSTASKLLGLQIAWLAFSEVCLLKSKAGCWVRTRKAGRGREW